MKYLILVLVLFVAAGCSNPESSVVQVCSNNETEMEALKTEYKENWQKEKESKKSWIKARKEQDVLALKIIEAKTAEESFEFARQLAEIGPIEKKLWKDWNDAISRRYAIIERMGQLSK